MKNKIEKLLPFLFPDETDLSIVSALEVEDSLTNPYDKRDCDFSKSFLVLKHSKHGQHESCHLFAAFLYWTEGERGWIFESDFNFPRDPQWGGSWTAKWRPDPTGENFDDFIVDDVMKNYKTFQSFKQNYNKWSNFDVSMMNLWNKNGWTVETE